MANDRELRFREDGTFTIVQFTDIHWQDGGELDLQSKAAMELVLDAEQPDFVMFTGDVIYTGKQSDGSCSCDDPRQALRDAVAAVEQRCVPWGIVFGNHDTENDITREELMDEVLKHAHAFAEPGPLDIHGTGNYVLPVLGADHDQAAALLYCLDSGAYSSLPRVPGYDWIQHDQVQWYLEMSRKWKARMQDGVLPSIAFFHIPLPEYKEAWDKEICYGNKYEEVCAAQTQAGFFSALLVQGDVTATFCGHDHTNDYWGEIYGIRLYYGRATGYNTYGKEGFPRGARVIRLTENERNVDSWLRLSDGTSVRDQPEHRPLNG
ncbi:3',5'-cyclic AMP phosphodiesterase CpdA [Paenibacillus endophyticus]|uniref:3',5'-cyclic AMP phosphodiesterase CpdA n=1 Tax=Paenibacillus endophyticus TaxID=1294268 RepID=A0A7W5CAI1_9BACL|nr:metallophosphoesterase family protein [Paenibacillus endophyticus]MBB3153705.1 3',5'-cyclic AMP phosphodiesterase CpdA [Paenibacillus endophyticus]